MATPMLSVLHKTRASLDAERTARAQGAARAARGYFAAVMGRSIERALTDVFADRGRYIGEVQGALAQVLECTDADWYHREFFPEMRTELHTVFQDIQERLGQRLGDANLAAGSSLIPPAGLGIGVQRPAPFDDLLEIIEASKDEDEAELNSVLREAEELTKLSTTSKASRVRAKVEKQYLEQMAFVAMKSKSLAFVIRSLEQIQVKMTDYKERWIAKGKEECELFDSKRYTKLQRQEKAMETDQTHHESDLQRFFDNASQGTSLTASVQKTDKVKLTIATDLEARKAGFRQIQLMDLYCLTRGNEMWAIIPSIKRVGHDFDPLSCLH